MPIRPSAFAVLLLLPCTIPGGARAQHPSSAAVVPGSRETAHAPAQTSAERRASHAFEAAKALGAPELYAFLRPFPKGGDLHMHLSGAIYAETMIREAAESGMCVAAATPACTLEGNAETPARKSAGQPPADPEAISATEVRRCPVALLDARLPGWPLSLTRPQANGNCAAGQLPAAAALTNQPLFDAMVDSFSMRGYVPQEGITGHDQFFSTFARFSGLKSFTGEWLDEVATRAAAQNEQYLEVMETPPFKHAASLASGVSLPADDTGAGPGGGGSRALAQTPDFAMLRQKLLDAGLREEIAVDRRYFAEAEARRLQAEGCTPATASAASGLHWSPASNLAANPACGVRLRFLYQVLRAFPPQQVFAQTLLGFEVAQAELESGHPLVVGINFVQPEDAHLAMRDYHLQMRMLDYLHSVYPRVRVSLHAGELAFGMVPPDGLNFHIREAVELGHAERIGHGMDVLYETDPNGLLSEMARKHIMVEVNLTSNDVILGRTRTDHPLAAYRAARVPFALSTDDEGVSRIDLTHEYVKAAEEQNLGYADLKRSARASLEHSFLPGASLWSSPDDFLHAVAPCAAAVKANSVPAPACTAFLAESERAQTQWDLERRLAAFEAGVH